MNLLPLTVSKSLALGEFRPTMIVLKLDDRSARLLKGVMEDVLVKVGRFVFSIHFVVFDIEKV